MRQVQAGSVRDSGRTEIDESMRVASHTVDLLSTRI